jgi:hypothetical protein
MGKNKIFNTARDGVKKSPANFGTNTKKIRLDFNPKLTYNITTR